ncbi:MAG TPA: hypothetical protein VNR38_18915 [Ureibacillus sp.]|nr:hypothetical protein [Ureibacillus sp.]
MMDLTYKLQGDPPVWYKEAKWYYENIHGEQWIATIEDNHVIFSGLDIGWKEMKGTPQQAEEAYKIIFGEIEQNKENPLTKYGMNTGELLWMASVLSVAMSSFASNSRY